MHPDGSEPESASGSGNLTSGCLTSGCTTPASGSSFRALPISFCSLSTATLSASVFLTSPFITAAALCHRNLLSCCFRCRLRLRPRLELRIRLLLRLRLRPRPLWPGCTAPESAVAAPGTSPCFVTACACAPEFAASCMSSDACGAGNAELGLEELVASAVKTS